MTTPAIAQMAAMNQVDYILSPNRIMLTCPLQAPVRAQTLSSIVGMKGTLVRSSRVRE